MVNFSPNEQDPRDGKRGDEKTDPRESGGELNAHDAGDRNPGTEQEGDDRHAGHRHSVPLGAPVESRENGAQQHGRRGQAESPVQTNHYEPPRQKEGHE